MQHTHHPNALVLGTIGLGESRQQLARDHRGWWVCAVSLSTGEPASERCFPTLSALLASLRARSV